MANSDFKAKYLDPRWQRKRLEIYERDHFACRFCGEKGETLHVHHVHYDHKAEGPWDYRDTSLLTLCWSCHKAEEEYLPWTRTHLMANLAQAGFLNSSLLWHLAEAFKTNTPMSSDEADGLADTIMTWMGDRDRKIEADKKQKASGEDH